MQRTPVTNEDIQRWKALCLGQGEGAGYKPWIDVRSFSSKGRMSRPLGVSTGREHHLFSDNEENFFLMADYAKRVVDIREQYPLLPETDTQEIAKRLGIRHQRYPKSTTPLVMTTDFLLTLVNAKNERSFAAFSIKSAEALRGKKRKSVLAHLEIERRYWLMRGIPWALFTDLDFDDTLIDNLVWLNYVTVESAYEPQFVKAQVPDFIAAFSAASQDKRSLQKLLQQCKVTLGGIEDDLATQLFRYCAWHQFIQLDLSIPIGLRRVPQILSIERAQAKQLLQGDSIGYAATRASI